jgi:hypothetical protein
VGEDYLNKYTQAMTGRHFKFIIFPESPRVDIPALIVVTGMVVFAQTFAQLVGYNP